MQLGKISWFGASLGVIVLCASGVSTLLPSTARAEDAPTYKPPMLGAPETRRVGGGTRGLSRGVEDTELRLVTLVPQSTGWSATDQPTLYWAISAKPDKPVEITVVNANPESPEAMLPLVETSVEAPEAGIHAFSLAEHDKRLEADVEYEWFARIALDPKHPSNDIVASGTLIYRPLDKLDAEVAAKIKNAKADELPAVYAEAGFWYDALASLSAQIAADPGNEALKAQRAALLEQVGLPDVGAFVKP